MYNDVRAAVDLCHRDGTLKEMVAKDPERYVFYRSNFGQMSFWLIVKFA